MKTLVLLTLRDRCNWTPFFLRYSIFKQFDYLILDSSASDVNHSLIIKENLPNLLYQRSCPETGTVDYITKVIGGLHSSEHEFVIMCDNDDLVLPKGVTCAVETAIKSGSVGAGGPVLGFTIKTAKSFFASPPLLYSVAPCLTEVCAEDRLFNYRHQHANIWNHVYRRKALVAAWDHALSVGVNEHHQLEWVVCDFLLSLGTIAHTAVPHYLRLENQRDRLAMRQARNTSESPGGSQWMSIAKEADSRIGIRVDINEYSESSALHSWSRRLSLLDGTARCDWPTRKLLQFRGLLARLYVVPMEVVVWLGRKGIFIPVNAFHPFEDS